VVPTADEAMDKVRQAELRDEPQAVAKALSSNECKTIKGLMWGMRKNPSGWSGTQLKAMHWLQHSGLKSARAWRLKMALREVYEQAAASNDQHNARADLNAWLSWARRCRLGRLRKLAKSISERAEAIVRGQRFPHRNQFHRHCVLADVRTEASADSSVQPGIGKMRLSDSTRHGIEPTSST